MFLLKVIMFSLDPLTHELLIQTHETVVVELKELKQEIHKRQIPSCKARVLLRCWTRSLSSEDLDCYCHQENQLMTGPFQT